MRRGLAAFLLAVGALAVVAGLVLGSSSMSTGGSYSCGSVFSPAGANYASMSSSFASVSCERDLGSRATSVWALLVVGGLSGVVGTVGMARREPVKV